jgi:hypothetical protein
MNGPTKDQDPRLVDAVDAFSRTLMGEQEPSLKERGRGLDAMVSEQERAPKVLFDPPTQRPSRPAIARSGQTPEPLPTETEVERVMRSFVSQRDENNSLHRENELLRMDLEVAREQVANLKQQLTDQMEIYNRMEGRAERMMESNAVMQACLRNIATMVAEYGQR